MHDQLEPSRLTALDDTERSSRRYRTQATLAARLSRPAPTVWLSGAEASEYLGVSWPTMRKLLIERDIPHLRLGTLWKIDVAVLDDHLHTLAHTRQREPDVATPARPGRRR